MNAALESRAGFVIRYAQTWGLKFIRVLCGFEDLNQDIRRIVVSNLV